MYHNNKILKIMNLSLVQHLIVFYWAISNESRYAQYSHYIHVGVQPKYAFEIASSKNG